MRTTAPIALAFLAGLLPWSAIGAAAPPAAALSAYNVGQSYARFVQDVTMPGTCGIALERERCNADFRAVRQWRGSDPTDASYSKWLADGGISLHPSDWNGSYVPEKGWSEDALFAWWYTAGVISIAIRQPRMEATSEYLAHYVTDLSLHPAASPEGFRGLLLSSGSPFERAQPLQQALDAAVPPAPYPAPSFGPGLIGAAQLGAYVSTLQQLVDNPLALSRPDSRAFAAIVLAELDRRHREFSDGLSVGGLQAEAGADIPSDPAQLDTLWRKPLTTQVVNTKWPDGPRKAILLGLLVAQVAYNAAVLRDSTADAGFRGAIAHLSPPAGMSQDMKSALAALQAIPYAARGGSWDQINKAATRATLEIIAGR